MGLEVKVSSKNLIDWSSMEDWENGASAAPTEHVLSGAGAAVSRSTTFVKVGTYVAAVQRNGADATLYHDFPDYDDYKGRKMTFACWVYATVGSRARIAISDGVGSTNSSYHTGGSGWERLTVTHDVDSSATRIRVEMQVNTGNTTAYFDDGKLFESDEDQKILTDLGDVVISEVTPSYRFKGRSFDPARREGVMMPSRKLSQLTMRVRGDLRASTAAGARTLLDSVKKAFLSHRISPDEENEQKDFYVFDDRLVQGHLDDFRETPKAAMTVYDFEVRLVCPYPFMRAVNKTRDVTDISTSPATATVNNPGTYLSRPIIRITATGGSITSLTLENLTSGQKLSYSGTITTGNELTIDTENLTVENNGTGDLANFTGDTDFHLVPGNNEIKFTGSNGDELKFDFFARYL